MRGKHLKCILTCLYCSKDYKINVCHSDTQRNVSHKNDTNAMRILYTLSGISGGQQLEFIQKQI